MSLDHLFQVNNVSESKQRQESMKNWQKQRRRIEKIRETELNKIIFQALSQVLCNISGILVGNFDRT